MMLFVVVDDDDDDDDDDDVSHTSLYFSWKHMHGTQNCTASNSQFSLTRVVLHIA